jgi:hypothetical protein
MSPSASRTPRRPSRRVAAAILAAVALVGACSDDEPDSAEPARGFEQSPQDEAAAVQAQLTLDDLEGEWDVEDEPPGSLQGIFDLTPECADLKGALTTSASSRTAEPGVRRFTSVDGEVITSGVTVYEDAASAEDFMAALRDGDAATCLASIISQRDGVEAEGVADESVEAGDDTYAITVVSPDAGEGVPDLSRLVWVRAGRVILAFGFDSFSATPLEEGPAIASVEARAAEIT